MKILTREAIQRMFNDRVGGVGFGAGGSGEGGASSDYFMANFVSIDYWNTIFVVHGKQKVTVTDGTSGTQTVTITDVELPPNSTPSTTTNTDSETGDVTVTEITIESIEVKYNFWSDGGVSALGTNGSGGGGGGDTLNALLANINDSSIGDIAPTASEVGKCLVYAGNNTWAWATPGGGGGGLTYDLSWSYGSVTSASGDSYDGSASKSFVIPKNTGDLTNNSGFITSSALSGYLQLAGGTMTGALTMAGQNGAIIMSGKNIYLGTSGISSNTSGDIVFNYGSGNEKARIWVDNTFSSALGPNYRCYDTSGNLIVSTRLALASEIPSLSGYATQTWVQSQGYLTAISITPTSASGANVVTYGGVSGGAITLYSSTIASLINNAGYTWWGATMSSGAVNGQIMQTSGNIYMHYANPHIYMGSADKNVLEYDSRYNSLAIGYSGPDTTTIRGGTIRLKDASGNDMAITTTLASKRGIVGSECIGVNSRFMFYWSTDLNAVVVTDTSGNAVNFCSLGGISALGVSTVGGLSELTVNTLKGVRYLQNASGAISITSGNSYIYIGAGSGSNVYIADSNNTYFDASGHLHLTDKRLYLDATRYMYVSNSHLYFYNGSTSVQIA